MMNLGARSEFALGGLGLLILIGLLAVTGHCDAGVSGHFGIVR